MEQWRKETNVYLWTMIYWFKLKKQIGYCLSMMILECLNWIFQVISPSVSPSSIVSLGGFVVASCAVHCFLCMSIVSSCVLIGSYNNLRFSIGKLDINYNVLVLHKHTYSILLKTTRDDTHIEYNRQHYVQQKLTIHWQPLVTTINWNQLF